MNIEVIKELIEEYGEDKTLGEILKHQEEHKCLMCNGTGTALIKNEEYEKALFNGVLCLPPEYKKVKCNVCNGRGYLDI